MKVNDVHSQLNETAVAEVVPVDSLDAVRSAVSRAARPISVAGGRHAMGGQQFCSGGVVLDTRPLSRVLDLDAEAGIVDVEAGIQWPQLLTWLAENQAGDGRGWGIRQKQTGADRLSIGGALAANVHGRGLAFPPFVADVESFTLVGPGGDVRVCSREENPELFGLAVGGYGLFGVVSSVRVRLMRRRKLERLVEVRGIEGLDQAFDERVRDGFLFGDFQFSIDPADPEFLRRGVFSCYRPVAEDTPVPENQRALSRDDWRRLLFLAHTDKTAVWNAYTTHYLATSGQIYLSDAHQLAEYLDDYHLELDRLTGGGPATEMITEVYVPRGRLDDFMAEAADDFRRNGVDVVYGTIRVIERDTETFLAWAREPWACVIFNLHTIHTPGGLEHAAATFRRLIDMAIARGGSYFLTYHRWAQAEQVKACYPQFREFLAAKRRYDPEERFQSDWYRHYAEVFA